MAKLLTGTRIYGTANVDSVLVVGNVTSNNSTSNTTGSLVVSGGLGVSGNVNVSNTINILSLGTENKPLTIQGGQSGVIGVRIGASEALDFYTIGGYPHFFATGGARTSTQFAIAHTGSAVNYLQTTGNTTGGGPVISGQGSDTNVGININPKGAGSANITSTANSTSNTTGALVVTGGMGITGNVFMSAGNNWTSGVTNSNAGYRLGWADNYFFRSPVYSGVYYNGNFLSMQSGNFFIESGAYFIPRSSIYNDSGPYVTFASVSGIDLQNTAPAVSTTTGALKVAGGAGVSGNLYVGNNLVVTGNLTITGNVNTQNVQQLAVADPLVLLGIGNYTTDAKDIGFAAHYNDGTNAHAGIIRDSTTKEFYVFKGYTPEVDATNNIDITDPSFQLANVNALYVKGNVITSGVNYITITGNTTSSAPTITSAGSDTNVGININPKGAGSANITSTANSTSNTSGALVVTGGVGITGNLYTGNIVVSGANPTITMGGSGVTNATVNIGDGPQVTSTANLLVSACTSATIIVQGTSARQVLKSTVGEASLNIASTVAGGLASLTINGSVTNLFVGNTAANTVVSNNTLTLASNQTGGVSKIITQANTASLVQYYNNLATGSNSSILLTQTGYGQFGACSAYIYANTNESGINLSSYGTLAEASIKSNLNLTQILLNNSNGPATLNIRTGAACTATFLLSGTTGPAYANVGATGTASQVNIISNLPSTSNATGALVVTGGVGVSGNLNVGGNITGNVAPPTSATSNVAIGYLTIPQNLNPLAANTYTLALTDLGKHIYLTLTSANANSANIYIPTTANVAFPIGAAVNIVLNGANSANIIANSGVTMYLAGNTGGITGSNTRILAPYSMASVLCVAANTWYISGVGIT